MANQAKRLRRKNKYFKTRAEMFGGGFDKTLSIFDLMQVLDRSRCCYCNDLTFTHKRTIEHLIPLSRMGKHTLKNLSMACDTCNQLKGCLTDKEFIKLRHEPKQATHAAKTTQKIVVLGHKIVAGLRKI